MQLEDTKMNRTCHWSLSPQKLKNTRDLNEEKHELETSQVHSSQLEGRVRMWFPHPVPSLQVGRTRHPGQTGSRDCFKF